MPLCVACSTSDTSVEFDSVADLMAHSKGGHMSRPAKPLPPPRKPVKPSATELKETEEKGTKVISTTHGEVIEHPKDTTVVIVKPLELRYKWTGTHPQCDSTPRTIEAQVEDGVIVIAYCMNCDKQLSQMKVPAIPKK